MTTAGECDHHRSLRSNLIGGRDGINGVKESEEGEGLSVLIFRRKRSEYNTEIPLKIMKISVIFGKYNGNISVLCSHI